MEGVIDETLISVSINIIHFSAFNRAPDALERTFAGSMPAWTGP
jgi:hypothetical protein